MGSADLVRAQYAGLDFHTHLDDLRARVQVKYASDYNDFAVSALGMMLLDATAFGLDTLSFYLDRRATDNYLSTARTRKSVARLTRQLGYKMRAAVASSVDLSVTIESPGFDVPMPEGFQFKGPNSLIYECAQPVTWLATDTNRTKSVSCYEGQTITENFVSDGTANQVFQLKKVPDKTFVVAGSVNVLVNGLPFQESEFLSFDTTDQFEVGYNDDPPTVRFGDGVAGNIPTTGATIAVTYVACRGKDGLVNSHTIVKELNPLVIAFQTIAMTVDNPLGSVGGDDPEDIEHAKIFAPQVYKSRYVAVTRPDYDALAGSYADPLFGRVAVAQAISSRSAVSDLYLTDKLYNVIQPAIDAPLLEAGGAVTITGTASIDATTGAMTGTGTLFSSELKVGSWIKISTDSTSKLRQVTTITNDRQAVVVPAPLLTDPPITTGAITRYGSALTQARARTKQIYLTTQQVVTDLTATATHATNVDTQLTSIVTTARSNKDLATTANIDSTAVGVDVTNAITNGTYGVSHFVLGPTSIGSTPNGTVVYVAKAEGVTVRHVPGGGSLTISVVSNAITVTFASGGSTAQAVAEAINADASASLLVLAAYTGTGLTNADPSPVTPITIFIPSDTKTNLLNWLSDAQTKNGYVTSNTSSIVAGMGTIVSQVAVASQEVMDIGRNLTEGQMLALSDDNASIQLVLGNSGTINGFDSLTTSGDLVTDFSTIESSVISNKTTIQGALDDIYDHVDALLSADCKANLVTVPILTRDKAGFFTAPSKGLIRSVQSYLDARKEVTQTVQVTSGANALVAAEIEARIGVLPSYSVAITTTAVETVIDNILRNRKFGSSLYLSDLNDAVKAVPGVAYASIKIVAPIGSPEDQGKTAGYYIDYGIGEYLTPRVPGFSDGNLIVLPEKVITKKSVTVLAEPVTSA